MSDTGPSGRVLDFLIDSRRRTFAAGRKVLEIFDDTLAGPPPGERERYDGAWVALSNAAGVDLPALGRRVAEALVPGAAVVCVVPGARPLAPRLRRALLGREGAVSGRHDPGRSPERVSLARWREGMGRAFRWRQARALGVLLTPGEGGEEAETSALVLAGLATLEHLIGTWPVVRGLGERILLEGERR